MLPILEGKTYVAFAAVGMNEPWPLQAYHPQRSQSEGEPLSFLKRGTYPPGYSLTCTSTSWLQALWPVPTARLIFSFRFRWKSEWVQHPYRNRKVWTPSAYYIQPINSERKSESETKNRTGSGNKPLLRLSPPPHAPSPIKDHRPGENTCESITFRRTSYAGGNKTLIQVNVEYHVIWLIRFTLCYKIIFNNMVESCWPTEQTTRLRSLIHYGIHASIEQPKISP